MDSDDGRYFFDKRKCRIKKIEVRVVNNIRIFASKLDGWKMASTY